MKPHKHAAIIKAYADRAQVSETPWDIIEYREPGQKYWTTPNRGLAFDNYHEYRIKPRTININGFEVPEPFYGDMDLDKEYFIPSLSRAGLVSEINWQNIDFDVRSRNLGIIHLTQEAAELHAKALLSFTKK